MVFLITQLNTATMKMFSNDYMIGWHYIILNYTSFNIPQNTVNIGSSETYSTLTDISKLHYYTGMQWHIYRQNWQRYTGNVYWLVHSD